MSEDEKPEAAKEASAQQEKPKRQKKPPETPSDILSRQQYLDKVLTFTSTDRLELNKLYRAMLRASQYQAFTTNGEAFCLLEGSVRRNEKGEYIFTPNEHLEEMLNKKGLPALLKIEENRFLELVKLALLER